VGEGVVIDTDHLEPMERWRAVSDWYAAFASERHWEFLAPMVSFAGWIGSQPFAAALYPHTSHEHLCVHLRSGYPPDEPCIFACVRSDRQFECGLRGRKGRLLARRISPIESAHDVFASALIRLGLEA